MSNPVTSFVIDQYSFLDYKVAFSSPPFGAGVNAKLAPTWVGEMDQRRIRAYMIYEAYYRNSARHYLSPDADKEDKEARREYGDPFVIVEMILGSLLGNQQKIYVPDAQSESPGLASVNETDAPPTEPERYQELLSDWAEKEKLFRRMQECERNAIKSGDGVYVIGWNEKLKRPKLRVYDPGFYFPVLDEDTLDENGFPTKVHIAWEYVIRRNEEDKFYVRRITWELETLAQEIDYPWGPSDQRCLMTDAVWDKTDLLAGDVQDFSMQKAKVKVNRQDLKIDFIPVIHMPNWVSEEEHFGISSLGPLMQVLDDIAACDTDLSLASSTTGSPVIAIHGAQVAKDDEGRMKNYGPRTVLETGDGGASLLDTSRSLDALLKYREELGDNLSEKSRVPKTLLGRVDPSKVPSGIVLTLSFSPHSGLIRNMRQIRDEKYSLMLDFVGKMFWASTTKSWMSGVFPAVVKWGSYLPADKTEVMNLVIQGLQAHAISLDTAVLMLIEAGLPIDDAKEEIAKIIANDFSSAEALVSATGDLEEGRKRLGLPPLPASAMDLGGPGGNGGVPAPAGASTNGSGGG